MNRSNDVLLAIHMLTALHGIPPTVRELCEELDFSSTNTVDYYLKQLYKSGKIKRIKGKSRGIVIP